MMFVFIFNNFRFYISEARTVRMNE